VVKATFSGLVTAGGVTQWLHCAGDGPVTVVVVPGLGSTASDWSQVRPAFERIARTCVYDRPGLGHSPRRPGSRLVVDAGLDARELGAALTRAGEHGPYVVVGHSFGGLVARAFIHQNLREVVAVLLAESVTPGDPTLGAYWHEAGVAVDMRASSSATGGGPRLGSRPLLVMTASRAEADHLTGPAYGQSPAVTQTWLSEQRADLSLSTDSIQVIAHSGHVLEQDAPQVVIDGLRLLVNAAEDGAPLTCERSWTALHAHCRTG
jgi:pimeloyl-ACP methyl ester carboxylesterase